MECVRYMNTHLYVESIGGCHVSCSVTPPYFFESGALTEPGVDRWPASPGDPPVFPHSTGVTSVHSHAWVFKWVPGSKLRD